MNILDYIACPVCKSDVRLSGNSLQCEICNRHYKVIDNIPILVDMQNLPIHLRKQIAYFENEGASSEKYEVKEWQKSYLGRFFENFENVENKTVIDCGTGTGYMAIELAKNGAQILACDLTMKSLIRLKEIAKERGLLDKIIFVCCSAEQLPFKKNVADYFISNAVLEHLPKEKEAIQEIDRVLKHQAAVMIAVPLSYKYINPILMLVNYIHDKRIGHLRRYNEESIIHKFVDWRILNIYYTGHFNKVLKSLFNMMSRRFDEKEIERVDRLTEGHKYGASNIICFLQR